MKVLFPGLTYSFLSVFTSEYDICSFCIGCPAGWWVVVLAEIKDQQVLIKRCIRNMKLTLNQKLNKNLNQRLKLKH